MGTLLTFVIALLLCDAFAYRRRPRIRKRALLNFQDVVILNKEYSAVGDKCPLRVYGGTTAEASDAPYQVALRQSVNGGKTWQVFCGGSIVTTTHIVTAAHCFERPRLRATRVIAGTKTSTVVLSGNRAERIAALKELQKVELWRQLKDCFVHPRYNKRAIVNDIAVIQVINPISYTAKIKPIPMLSPTGSIPENTLCLVSGFGLIEQRQRPKNLRMACVPVTSFGSCKTIYRSLRSSETQICAGSQGKDSCEGDSGGPLACKGVLTGIVSYGAKQCGSTPGVYTRLSGFTDSTRRILFRSVQFSVQVKYNKFVIIIGLATLYIYYTRSNLAYL